MKVLTKLLSFCFILSLFCMSVSAANMMTDGYSYKNVFVQNHATGSYTAKVNTAITNWNNAINQYANSGVTLRSVVKNTTSSSGIYSESFSEGSSTLQQVSTVNGLYLVRSQNSSCNCHKTNWFNIFINTDMTSASIAVSVTAHEIGHAFGLNDDQSSSSRLMSYSRNRSTVVAPINDEVDSMLNWWDINH